MASQPFNNPSAQPELVEMFRSLLRKSRTEPADIPVAPAVITMTFGGAGGGSLNQGSCGLIEVTFPCRILGCQLYSGAYTGLSGTVPASLQPVAVTATIELLLGSKGAWIGGGVPIYGSNLAGRPALSAVPEASVDTTLWITDTLQPGDLLAYGLSSFTGLATFIVMSLAVRRVDATGQGVNNLTNTGGTAFTTAAGQPLAVRN
jgi:hypothetical protein